MNANTIRAAFWALFLGMAMVAGAGMSGVSPAAAAVRPAVGKPLQEAQSLAAAGNYSAALAKVNQAAAVGGLTAEESRVVNQMRAYINSKSSATSGKGKFANDYRAGKWSAVIQDAESLRGQLDANDKAAVATAYYKLGQDAQCVRYIRSNFGSSASEVVLQIMRACAFNAGDDQAQTDALEQLVARTGKAEYWGQLLKAAERTRGMNDHQTLDIYRIKFRTGTMGGANDYTLLAKLALEFGFPAEAMAVEQKGVDAKVLSGGSIDRLIAMTKTQMGSDAAGMAQKMAQAKASPNGDALVKLGENLWGQGKAQDAIDAIKAGMAKDKTDLNNAHTRLGMAYLAAGQKEAAAREFAKVKDDPHAELIAHLWTLYARR